MVDAYGARAAEYIDTLGTIEATAAEDREVIGSWAATVDGRIIDVGCGPGHWTGWLHAQGHAVEGIDPVGEFVAHAHRNFPSVGFGHGTADALDVPDGAAGGVLAWYSLIHLSADDLEQALTEFARVLAPGGGLLLGFFTGDRVETFPHAVTTAWFWPVDALVQRVQNTGFLVTGTYTRADPGARPHGAITAIRQPGGGPRMSAA